MFSILLFLSKKRKACILARFFFVLLFASPSCSLPFRPFSAYASNITILNSERTDWVGHTWKRNEVDFGSEHRATQQQKDQPRTKSSGVQKTSRFNQCQGAEEEKEKCRKERTFVFRKWILIPFFVFFSSCLGCFFEGKHCFSDQLFPYRCRCYYCFLSRMCSCYQRQALV